MNKKSRPKTKRTTTRSVLRLPDLEHAKTAVLNSLTSRDARRDYRHAIDEFVDWYCSEPRLALNRIAVLRYRSHLDPDNLLPAQSLWPAPDCQRLKGKRDRALLALLLACGLRRHEAVTLTLDNLQQREEHWPSSI